MGVIAIKQGVGKAVIEPFAPLAMQCRGQEVAKSNQRHILGQHQQDQEAGIHGDCHERILNWCAFNIDDRIHQQAGSFSHPNCGLADKGREDKDCNR